MELNEIRQKRLKEWFADKKLPPKDASFISQVIGGKFIGERAARRLENDHGMPELYLDTPFDKPGLTPEIKKEQPKRLDTELKMIKVVELLETLPDDEADLLLNEFQAKLEGRVAYYDEKFREYIKKHKLNDF